MCLSSSVAVRFLELSCHELIAAAMCTSAGAACGNRAASMVQEAR